MIKKIINFIINFIMSVLVLGLIGIIIISNTILSKEYIKKKLSDNKFYDRTYSDIKKDFENYTMQSGLELEILDNLFTKEKVITDIDSKIDAIYDRKQFQVETDSIRNELDNRINNALEENHRIPNDDEKASINLYEDAIVNSYKSGILYGRDFSINSKILYNYKTGCIIGIVVCSVILLVINRNILKYISFVGINLLFSGILCASIKFLLEKRIQHILILDAKFSNFLVNSLTDIIRNFYKVGIIAVCIGCALILFGSLEKIKKTIENKNN